MTSRPEATYRASRRNLAKAHRLVWRKLERETGATVRVMLPRWAWEMPRKSVGMAAGLMEDVTAPGYVTKVVEMMP